MIYHLFSLTSFLFSCNSSKFVTLFLFLGNVINVGVKEPIYDTVYLILWLKIHDHTFSLSIRPGFWSTTNFLTAATQIVPFLRRHNTQSCMSNQHQPQPPQFWNLNYLRTLNCHTHPHTHVHTYPHIFIMPMKKLKCINTFVHVSRYM